MSDAKHYGVLEELAALFKDQYSSGSEINREPREWLSLGYTRGKLRLSYVTCFWRQ